MPGAAAADGPIAIVAMVGTAKPNVKKYPDSSRRFSVIDLLRYAMRGNIARVETFGTCQTPEQAVRALLALALIAPEPPETHLIASTREGRTAEVSKCHAAGHLVAVNSAIEFERQRHRVGNRYLPR